MQKAVSAVGIFIIAIGFTSAAVRPALAVPPPDFIFNIGSQLIQIFSVMIMALSVAFSVVYQFFRSRLTGWKAKPIIIIVAFLVILAIASAATYGYNYYQQKKKYSQWLEESERYNQTMEEQFIPESAAERQDNRAPKDDNDQLIFGQPAENDERAIDPSHRFIDNVGQDADDESARFIKEYYADISNGNIDEAYERSKKSVDKETFSGWYANTTSISIDKMVRIDNARSSLELTLVEGDSYTRYGVLMTLQLEKSQPVRIEKSEVKVLEQGKILDDQTAESSPAEESDFFTANQGVQLAISNDDFQGITKSTRTDYIVLDAREDLEYNNGHYPGSLHIRFSDLKAGRWIELPGDKYVFVICWSGIRGREVAEFLRTKKVVSRYLQQGASGWVDFGGSWNGNINFEQKYSDPKYKNTLSTKAVKKEQDSGAVIADCREPWKYQQSHINGSISLPLMYTPTVKLETAFGQLAPGSRIITVCDDYVNCFDAKITGVEAESRGHEFIGRYNRPWEY